jgi:MinD-like ATPase involved in chromosome partitioning or flagellar assembly/tetratricopeptide (TPR) repeat protein
MRVDPWSAVMADDPTSDGKIVTFYSFKGGTGRTMALANVAWILASNGLKVLVVDWDLDSPGLHRYFHPFLAPAKVAATPGIIELITEYVWDATAVTDPPADWVRDYARILPHAISVSWPFPGDGTLDFVSAGRQNLDYSSAATSVDWDNFYDRLDGGPFIDALRADMKAHYDYTLIDSRTGLSDIADICTVHLPDILVNCFTLNDQSIDGAAKVARNLAQRYHYRNIQVLPVPTRIDEAEKDKADVGLAAAKARFEGLRARLSAYDESDYWAAVSIPYKPFYAFEETLAVFGDAPRSPLSLLGAYERLTVAMTDGRIRAAGPMTEETRLTFKAAFLRRQEPTGDIYLSYVPEDRMWADWIAAVLAPRGVRVVRPAAASAAGGSTREDAERGAGAASRTIAVLSAAYLRSPHARGVWDAMGAADPTGTSRRLIPVRVGETRLEPPFSERTVLDLTRRDESQATEELLKALGYPPGQADAVAPPLTAEPRYPRTIPPVWRVPTRNASFTGRNQVLENLHDGLIGNSTAVVLPVALHGLGGVGKTQVAQEYAHRFMADYDLVWWVPSEQRDLINPSLADLAQHLGVRPADSTAETVQAVREALRRGRPYDRWLLIFDNADEPGELEDFFPGGPGHVIVTSRNPAWSKLAEPVAVDVFSRRESLDYLQRRVQSLSVEDATLVASELGDLPLAIEQAGAWLAATGMAATEYVDQIRERFAATMELGRPASYPTSVAVTYQLSFERLRSQSPAAARLLELCACFAPDPISLSLLNSDEMVKSLIPYDRRLRAARTVLGLLVTDITRFSLAKVDREMTSNSIQVHRLVQAAIRDQMQPASYHDEAVHEVHKVLAGARPRQGDTDDPANWARYDLIWPHLGPSEVWNCDDEEARQLLIDRVRYLWKRGDYDEALEVAHKLEEQWQQKIGPDDEQTLSLRFHIANVLRSQGKFEGAHELDTEIFAKQQESLGDDHPSTLLTAGSLGGDLRGLGRFGDALALDEATYSRNKDLLGPDDPNTLSSANNLAIDLRLVGDCFRARDLDRETRNYRQVVLGPDHPYTLHSASMLARDIREAGDYAGSVELLRETYERYLAVLGENFVDTLRTGKSLAVSLRKVGRLDDAYTLTKEIDARYQRSHDPSHPDSLACKLNLACDLSARDEKTAAFEVASWVVEAYQATIGGMHPFTLVAENNISTYLRGIGSLRDALDVADQTLTAMRSSLDDDHPFTLSCQINRANCLHDLGRLSEAETLQRDILERLKKTLGAGHPDTQVCEANLAIVLRAQERVAEAEALQLRVIGGLGEALGSDHPSVAALREWRLQNRDLEAQPT